MKTSLTLGLCALFSLPLHAATFAETYKQFKDAEKVQNYTEATVLAEQALELGKEKFGENSQNVTNLMYSLANMYAATRKHSDAYKLMRSVIDRMGQEYGEQSTALLPAYIDQLNHISRSSLSPYGIEKQRFRGYTNRAIELTEKAISEDPEAEALYLYQLSIPLMGGNVYLMEPYKARSYIKRAEQALTTKYGDRDVRTLTARFHVANLDISKKRYQDAAQKLESIVSIVDDALEVSHPYELAAHAKLVQLYEKMDQSDKATEHCMAIGRMTPWQDDIEPTPLYRMSPDYPSEYVRQGKEGWVRFEFDISPQGFVKDLALIESKGGKKFVREAKKALENWRYAPKFEEGKAVTAKARRVQLDFKMSKG